MVGVLTILGTVLLFLALLLSNTGSTLLYAVVFFVSGLVMSARRIWRDGALVEMSTAENLALCTRATGTLNLTVAAYPLIVGIPLRIERYLPVFSLAALAAAVPGVLVHRLRCPLVPENHTRRHGI